MSNLLFRVRYYIYEAFSMSNTHQSKLQTKCQAIEVENIIAFINSALTLICFIDNDIKLCSIILQLQKMKKKIHTH